MREERWCYKAPPSLDGGQAWQPHLAGHLGLGQNWGLPQIPPGFTLMTSPRTSVTLSFLTLSTFPAAMVQARGNYGQVAILRTQAGLTLLPGFPLLLAQPRAAWEDHGEVVFRDSQKCHMQGRTPGPLPNGPLLVACLWVHGMDWGRKGKQTHESGGVGSVGCEIIWQTSRISKESCFWNLEFKLFSQSTFLWLEGEIKISVIPLAFTFVLNYQILKQKLLSVWYCFLF